MIFRTCNLNDHRDNAILPKANSFSFLTNFNSSYKQQRLADGQNNWVSFTTFTINFNLVPLFVFCCIRLFLINLPRGHMIFTKTFFNSGIFQKFVWMILSLEPVIFVRISFAKFKLWAPSPNFPKPTPMTTTPFLVHAREASDTLGLSSRVGVPAVNTRQICPGGF